MIFKAGQCFGVFALFSGLLPRRCSGDTRFPPRSLRPANWRPPDRRSVDSVFYYLDRRKDALFYAFYSLLRRFVLSLFFSLAVLVLFPVLFLVLCPCFPVVRSRFPVSRCPVPSPRCFSRFPVPPPAPGFSRPFCPAFSPAISPASLSRLPAPSPASLSRLSSPVLSRLPSPGFSRCFPLSFPFSLPACPFPSSPSDFPSFPISPPSHSDLLSFPALMRCCTVVPCYNIHVFGQPNIILFIYLDYHK